MSAKSNLTWENPPSAQRRSGGSARINSEVNELKKRPGVWAKLRDRSAAGNYVTYKKRGVMTRVSSVGGNYYAIWGIWFGTREEPVEVEAKNLEPNVIIIHPSNEHKYVVTDVTDEDSEGKVVLVLSEKGKRRKLKVAGDRELTAIGYATK